MKKCTKCKVEKPGDQFYKSSKNKDGLQSWCKGCSLEARSAHYHNNRTDELAKNSIRDKEVRERNKEMVKLYLNDNPCVDCGEEDIVVLEFDHRDPTAKSFNVGSILGYSWSRVEAEIAKCDVRCANCHCRRTAQQFGSWRV